MKIHTARKAHDKILFFLFLLAAYSHASFPEEFLQCIANNTHKEFNRFSVLVDLNLFYINDGSEKLLSAS